MRFGISQAKARYGEDTPGEHYKGVCERFPKNLTLRCDTPEEEHAIRKLPYEVRSALFKAVADFEDYVLGYEEK